MIHAEDTVQRIKELLLISGVPQGDVLDEMLDHYLSDIEIQMSQSISHQEALRHTYQSISNSDFSYLQKKPRSKWLTILIVFIIFLTLSVISYFCSFSPSTDQIIPQNIEAPRGWPLTDPIAPITSEFGKRKHPLLKSIVLHKGIDIKAESGTPVLATGDAIVKETGYSEKAGNYIILKHNSRYSTRYTHLSSILVRPNEAITQGHTIGEVGSSGLSRGPHLHYEIMDKNVYIDPLEVVRP